MKKSKLRMFGLSVAVILHSAFCIFNCGSTVPVPLPPTYYLNLTWDDTNSAPVTYTVLVGTNSGSYFRWFSAGTNKQAAVTGLSPEREPYYFAVMAVQGGTNQSVPSPEFKWPWPVTNSVRVVAVEFSATFNGPHVDVPLNQWLTSLSPRGFFTPRIQRTNNIAPYEHLE